MTVFTKLLPWWERRVNSVRHTSAQDSTVIPHKLQNNRYSVVILVIARHALCEADNLWNEAIRVV